MGKTEGLRDYETFGVQPRERAEVPPLARFCLVLVRVVKTKFHAANSPPSLVRSLQSIWVLCGLGGAPVLWLSSPCCSRHEDKVGRVLCES